MLWICTSTLDTEDFNEVLLTENPSIGILANSEDPDEMPKNVSFHQSGAGLHCLLRQKESGEKRNTFFLNCNQ